MIIGKFLRLAYVCLAVTCICSAEETYSTAVKAITLLKSSTDVAGKAITYPKDGKPEVSCLLVELPVGQNTGWHYHKNPSVEYILQGEITIEDETGAKRHFKSGDSFAELIGRKHCGKNTGALPVKILMVVVGLVGDPVSSK